MVDAGATPRDARARARVAWATASSSTKASERESVVRVSVGIGRGVARAAVDEVGASRANDSVSDRRAVTPFDLVVSEGETRRWELARACDCA